MAKRIHYFGDINACAKHRHGANMLLDYIDSQDLSYGVVRRNFSDGSRIKVNKINPFLQTVDIYAGEEKLRKIYDWTLVYAPCPPPDSQLWEGWIQCDVEDLVADSWLTNFALIGWGNALWDVFSIELVDTQVSSGYELTDAGEVIYPDSTYADTGTAYGYKKTFDRTESTYLVTFFNGETVTFQNIYDENVALYITWQWFNYSGTGRPTLTVAGFDKGIWLAPGTYSGWSPQHTGGTTVHLESYVDWQSTYMIGFWKQELTAYNPSSYLDENNWVIFYDKLVYDAFSDMSPPTAYGVEFAWYGDMWWHGPGTWWGPADPPLGPTWIEDSYNANAPNGWDGCNIVNAPVYNDTSYVEYYYWDPSIFWTAHVAYFTSPYWYGTILGGTPSSLLSTWSTWMKGKFEGVAFEECLGTANFYSTAWVGDNIFPWMGRVYSKEELITGAEAAPAPHNLLIASYLKGDAAGPDSDGAPTLTSSGISETTYLAKYESDVSKAYGAVHPGWHNVFVDEHGNTWRAYGDLFAVLKEVREEEEF